MELRGLQAKPELNGQWGVVVKFIGSSERYRVQLDGGEKLGERWGVQPEARELACCALVELAQLAQSGKSHKSPCKVGRMKSG